MITTGEPYHEKGMNFFDQRDRQCLEKQLARRLQHLGYEVTKPLSPAPVV
jgi:hypothetical protein